jgi:hypothetical protein
MLQINQRGLYRRPLQRDLEITQEVIMKRRVFLGLMSIALVILIIIGVSSTCLGGAVCTPQDGSGTCEGECCRTLLTGGCVAGPCKYIF